MAEENGYIGKEVGNYRITREIASGGFGTVYEARHITLAKRVAAIKLLHTYLGSASDREKFIQEAQLLSELEHPHILPVLDVGFQDKQPYIIMKYAEGGSLKDRLRQHAGQPLPLAGAVTILTQIGQALDYAHRHMIVHRDLKPENILFNARGEALLADFGIAVMLPQARTGQIGQEGTPAYMAPEQFEGKASVKSDQYVLGCIAYELVTGQKPFEVDGVPLEALWYQHTKVTPTPPRQLNPAIPEELEQAILKAMEKKREARYADIATFCAAMENSLRTTRRLEQEAPAPEAAHENNLTGGDEQAPSVHNPISSGLIEAVANTPPSSYADELLSANDDDDEDWEDDISPTPPRVPTVRGSLNGDVSAQHDTQPPAMPVSQSSLHEDLEDNNSFSGSGYNKNSGSFPTPLVASAGTSRRRPRDVRRLSILLLAALVLCSLLLCGGLAFAAPGILPTPIRNYVTNVFGGGASGATVNITPKSARELNTYVIAGVTTGTADSAKRQVPARQLTYTTPPTQKTVNSTGKVNIPATFATGTMTFYDGDGTDYVINAHTVFTDANGVQIENNSSADIPAGGPQTGYGRITVPATAVTSGSAGNIKALDFNQYPCCGTSSVFMSNGLFSGGQNAAHFTAVQQSDIDGAANPLMPQLQQSALTSLNAQKHANEQFVNEPVCTFKATSDRQAGDRVSSFTVTVTATCSGYVYDQVATQQLATDLLKKKASVDLQDPNYIQVGNITASVVSATVDKTGTISMFVKAQGVWVYQFNDAIKKQLAREIAGKKEVDARTFLQEQPEIGAVGKIDIPGNNDTVMPIDPKQITVVVQNPPEVGRA